MHAKMVADGLIGHYFRRDGGYERMAVGAQFEPENSRRDSEMTVTNANTYRG